VREGRFIGLRYLSTLGRRRTPMQRPQRDEALLGLDGYEQMVNTFAQNAKAYWRLWGPLGEPMVRIVEAWAEQQRSYLRWLQQNYGERDRP
jgi:hypothetical protein